MIVNIKYIDGTEESFVCDKIECDGCVFIIKTESAEDAIIPYDGVLTIDYN